MKIFPTLLLLSVHLCAYSAKEKISVTILVQNTSATPCTIEVTCPVKYPLIDEKTKDFIHFKQLARAHINPQETQEITYMHKERDDGGPYGTVYAYPADADEQATKNTSLPSRCIHPQKQIFEISDSPTNLTITSIPVFQPAALTILTKNKFLKHLENLENKTAYEQLETDISQLPQELNEFLESKKKEVRK